MSATTTTTTTTTTTNMIDVTETAAAGGATVVAPGQAVAHWLAGDLVEALVTGDRTRGASDFMRITVGPGGGPPPHIHRREDELFYVVDGEFEFIHGEQVVRGGRGACMFLPRNVVHQFKNVGPTRGTVLVVATPGGFSRFVADAGNIAVDPDAVPRFGEAEMARLVAACAAHHVELLPTWHAGRRAAPRRTVRELNVLGLGVRVLLTGDETRGQFTVGEITARQPGDGVPAHRHRREDEVFCVLEGTFEFELPDRVVTAPPGTFVHVPRMTMHAFRNVGHTPAKLIEMHAPGGFEDFFNEADATELSDRSKIVAMMRKHGMDVAAPVGA